MDWNKLSGDVVAWGEKAMVTISEVADKAQAKLEEAKFRLEEPVEVGSYRSARHNFDVDTELTNYSV